MISKTSFWGLIIHDITTKCKLYNFKCCFHPLNLQSFFLECHAPSSLLQALPSGASIPFVPHWPAWLLHLPIGLLPLVEPSSLMSDWASPELWLSPRTINHPEPIAPLPICIPVYTKLSWPFLLSFLRLLNFYSLTSVKKYVSTGQGQCMPGSRGWSAS